MMNAVTFFINHDKEKKDILIAFKQYFTEEEHRQVKSDLLECISLLPSTSLYASKFVQLLHSICEEIVSESTAIVPSASQRLIHFEDLSEFKKAESTKFEAQDFINRLKTYVKPTSFDEAESLDFNYEQGLMSQQLLRFDLPLSLTERNLVVYMSKDSLISTSIMLFAEIFKSNHMNAKNKQ